VESAVEIAPAKSGDWDGGAMSEKIYQSPAWGHTSTTVEATKIKERIKSATN